VTALPAPTPLYLLVPLQALPDACGFQAEYPGAGASFAGAAQPDSAAQYGES